MPLQNRPLDWLIRIALAVVAAIPGAWIGIAATNALVYAIAALTDRDIAELKDMLIWSMITGLLAGGLAAIWLVLWLTSAGKWAQRVALIPLCIAALGGGAITVAAFDWPKSSGTPIIQYQLRLPAGAPLPERDKIGITVWREKLGQGCYIDQIRMADGRPEITGDLVLHTTYENPTMSLELDRASAGYWRLPYKPDAALEKSFGPWQRIEFIPTPRANVPPLPPGDYEIRYRVRKYM
jgi:hypothetical protein